MWVITMVGELWLESYGWRATVGELRLESYGWRATVGELRLERLQVERLGLVGDRLRDLAISLRINPQHPTPPNAPH